LLTGSSLNIYGENALITGGKATNAGGNIGTLDYIQNAVINMYDGTVSKGQAASGAPEIDTSITLADGVTVVKTKYAGLMIQSGAVLDISELKPEAKIVISAAKNQIISAASGNATAVAGCFRPTNGTLTVQATADNVLKVVAK